MALIKCSECGGTVSDKAEKCPHCGCPVSCIIQNLQEDDENIVKTSIENEPNINNEKKQKAPTNKKKSRQRGKKQKVKTERFFWMILVIICVIIIAVLLDRRFFQKSKPEPAPENVYSEEDEIYEYAVKAVKQYMSDYPDMEMVNIGCHEYANGKNLAIYINGRHENIYGINERATKSIFDLETDEVKVTTVDYKISIGTELDLEKVLALCNGEIEEDVEKSSEPEKRKEDNPVVVRVTNKVNIEEDIYNGQYTPRVEFDFKVENKTSKAIKGIEGVLTVKDMFGKEIVKINCDFTGHTIAVGSIGTYNSLGIDINQFMDEHIKLYNESYSDLQFEYEVSCIVYNDGTSEKY